MFSDLLGFIQIYFENLNAVKFNWTEENADDVWYRMLIVGEDEADVPTGKISVVSPIARAIMGKNEGDEVVVKVPASETKATTAVRSFHSPHHCLGPTLGCLYVWIGAFWVDVGSIADFI